MYMVSFECAHNTRSEEWRHEAVGVWTSTCDMLKRRMHKKWTEHHSGFFPPKKNQTPMHPHIFLYISAPTVLNESIYCHHHRDVSSRSCIPPPLFAIFGRFAGGPLPERRSLQQKLLYTDHFSVKDMYCLYIYIYTCIYIYIMNKYTYIYAYI